MAEDSVIALRRVYDGIQSLDVPMEHCITPEILQHCIFPHSRYVNHMEDNKTKCRKWKWQKKKGNIGRIESSTKKRQKLETTHPDLRKEADQLAIEAEKKKKMDLIVKSNALRSKTKEKMVELQTEEHKVKDLKVKHKKL